MRVAGLILLLFLPVITYAQKKTIRSFTLDNDIVAVSVDRPGDFYFVLKDGTLQHFTKDGEKVAEKKGNVPTFFDPRDGSRLFAYYAAESRYQYLSPQLEVVNELKLDSSFAINPVLLCPSGDHELWILDTADYSLKRTVLMGTSVRLENDMETSDWKVKPSFTMMREYQNFLFLLDERSGIFIYNGVGKRIRTIDISGLKSFNFLGEELYYVKGNKLKFLDLFSAETREEALSAPCDYVLLTDERMLTVQGRKVVIEEIKH